MKNIAPNIFRKRLFIEGYYGEDITLDDRFIEELLIDITNIAGMTPIIKPIIFSPSGKGSRIHHGIGGYLAWVESGISIYTWTDHRFFTIDIYTCKELSWKRIISFIQNKLKCKKLVYEEFRYE